MKTEIKILLELDSSNKAKGNCFENLIRNLLTLHQYDIRGNINFSGMEIDLVAEHKHTKDTLYVECKAKEKVTSDELSKFAFNVSFKKVDKGYFFRTQELESQAGALLKEIKERPEYGNLIFFEPNEIVRMLSDGKMIFEPGSSLQNFIISKRILAITYFGDYFIYLVNESNALPTKFILVDAKQNERKVSEEFVELIKSRVDEIANLELLPNLATYKKPDLSAKIESNIETISEVQESENWYDYLPASADKKHFVGRDEIRTKILTYFKQIREGKTHKRIFYLNGKSGWGKSSLVLELKDRCHNKHFKRKFLSIAIDTRSATSDNFVALSFKKLITSAIDHNFINKDLFSKDVVFTSNSDLLSSDSVKNILDYLNSSNKFLVLIFDQFEDVFRKKDFFKTFYKFLSDVTDNRPNLIIGFSWKSDFFIQSDDPSYHIWQQAKEQAREYTITEFGEKEIDGIIRQLEGSVGSLDKGIKDRIKESSQGLPWLTKKLCIHILDQIRGGLAKEKLIESNLNILDLFKKDEERLSANEFKAIKLIAKRAYDGAFFDETEVGDVVDGETIMSLLHRRLIIRSGANYNIYWDIYRDYLVTGEIPLIGESYLIRQGVNLCLEVFLLFDNHNKESLETLLAKHPKGITAETLYNILIELRNVGIIQKVDDFYSVNQSIEVSKEGFVEYIKSKFQNYTPFIKIQKLNKNRVSKSDVIQILKETFKQEFADNTWIYYANYMLSWLLLADPSLKEKVVEPVKGRGVAGSIQKIEDKTRLMPRSSLKEIVEYIPVIEGNLHLANKKYSRDLLLLDIVDTNRNLTDFGRNLMSLDETSRRNELKNKALSLPKVEQIKRFVDGNKKIKSTKVIEHFPNDFFDGDKSSSKTIYATKVLTWIR